MKFKLQSDFNPTGDQPIAIKELVTGLKKDIKYQTLLGVTGSGKTFTIANVIKERKELQGKSKRSQSLRPIGKEILTSDTKRWQIQQIFPILKPLIYAEMKWKIGFRFIKNYWLCIALSRVVLAHKVPTM